ncbi:type II toxin-antitoxin system PemK/MazF family toxin [Dokdonella sp.]|uniref:type II toxin-antitoxin system PemK/MazF family toxin n=2 Tax=Dokdonella sp. TaxID=2291710 RepID=UPI003BB182F4
MAYVPNRGDIVHLELDPASGREMKGPHFGLVLSGKVFNQQGLAMICPISQGTAAAARTYGTIVTLEIGHGYARGCPLPPVEIPLLARASSQVQGAGAAEHR